MLATILVIAFSGNSGAASAATESADSRAQTLTATRVLLPKCSAHRAVKFYARRLNEHRAKMRAPAVPIQRATGAGCPQYLAHVLQRKARAWRLRVDRYFAALYEKWRCIHEHEGAWNANTGNGYWGGLQMDWGFMHTYGPEFIRRYGLAHRWPVWAQLTAAERAFHGFAGFGGRGYSPWGTRGMCGL